MSTSRSGSTAGLIASPWTGKCLLRVSRGFVDNLIPPRLIDKYSHCAMNSEWKRGDVPRTFVICVFR